MQESFQSVALIGSYVPRQCGIATFTADLADAIAANAEEIDCFVVALNDRPEGYAYTQDVRFQINQDRLDDYHAAADFLNMSHVDVVSLQHEYGIYGGRRGSFVIELLKDLNMPVVTTLHTVLKDPPTSEFRIMNQLAALSDRLVVMSEHGAEFLRTVYDVPSEKITFIPHGIPDVPFLDSDPCRSKFVAADKSMVLTFGLLSPGKGVETMVDALPDIVRTHPQVLYFVVGTTHPHFKAENGEDYRLRLHLRAKELGVTDHIVFHDRFVSREELLEFIRAADIYVTPYVNTAQIVSGTLAYALGSGKAVVSTPYWYAQEMLADGRGRLVPFQDHQALARTINDLLDHPDDRLSMRRAAYRHGRSMVWPEVGRRYLDEFGRVRTARLRATAGERALDTLSGRERRLPEMNLCHLRRMTDGTGMLQHATFSVPNRAHGYCVDDNARALIVATMAQDLIQTDAVSVDLTSTYLSFLDDAFDRETHRFRNFMSYQRGWLEDVGSEDAHGRALWALGVVTARGRNKGHVAAASALFDSALMVPGGLSGARALAFSILGMQAYLRQDDIGGHVRAYRVREYLDRLGDRLYTVFRRSSTDDWPWFEDVLTYDLARLPQALMACGRITGHEAWVETGIRSLEWLTAVQMDADAGRFSPVGNQGWYPRGGAKAHYDQQPLEAAAMIDACIEAYKCGGGQRWIQTASICFDWFLGKNDQGVKLYDNTTHGCRDGLTRQGANENQGAESTLSWIMSLSAIYYLRGLTVAHIDSGK